MQRFRQSCTLDMSNIHVDNVLVCTLLKFKFITNKMVSLIEVVYSELSKSLYSYWSQRVSNLTYEGYSL